MGAYDATGNKHFFNTATVAYSGEDDKQIQAARIMERFLTGEGLTLRHIIGENRAQGQCPQPGRVDERINDHRRVNLNAKRCATRHPYAALQSRQAWVQVDGLDEHWMPARVEQA